MKIARHPQVESLLSCAAGAMPEAFAAVMASHIEVCSECREELARMEAIGTALFETLPEAAVARPAPVLALRAMEAESESEASPQVMGEMPAALARKLGSSLDGLPWSFVSPGVAQIKIGLSHKDRGSLRLFKLAPEQKLPEHGHGGSELTLVLRGTYHDGTGGYGPGDVADLGETIEHAPVAGPEGCICLTASSGRMRFKGRILRLLQPLTDF
jgi:putative transcriptional regulator